MLQSQDCEPLGPPLLEELSPVHFSETNLIFPESALSSNEEKEKGGIGYFLFKLLLHFLINMKYFNNLFLERTARPKEKFIF